MKILLLSPHCDDAALSLGAALMARLLGDEVHIAIVFAMSKYTCAMEGTAPLRETTRIRQSEERQAAAMTGCSVQFFPCGEPFVRRGFGTPSDICDPSRDPVKDVAWTKARKTIHRLLADDYAVVLAPLGYGHHIDHRIVSLCVRSWQESHDAPIACFYEDLPYCPTRNRDKLATLIPKTRTGLPFVELPLTGGDIVDKLALLELYRSQMTVEYRDAVCRHWSVSQAEVLWVPPAHQQLVFRRTQ